MGRNTPRRDYTYQPLGENQFRLLVLHPGFSKSKIKVSLEVHLFPGYVFPRPDYEAISYTWNNEIPARPINCHGRILRVTPNLHDALQHFRHRYKFRKLWVDAICINQSDPVEKAQQVPRMRSIYSGAKTTLAWLGLGMSADAWTFRTLSQYYAMSTRTSSPNPDLCKNGHGISDGQVDLSLEHTNKTLSAWYKRTALARKLKDRTHGYIFSNDYADLLITFLDLCGSEYFNRAWVYQEIAASKNVLLCRGGRCLDWESAINAIAGLSTEDLKTVKSPDRFGRSITLMSLFQKGHGHGGLTGLQDDFFYVVAVCSIAKCSNPRDSVYAFLGLCHIEQGLQLSVNYDASVAAVYTQATIEAIEFYREYQSESIFYGNANLIFLFCGIETFHEINGVPAWIPDYGDLKSVLPWLDVYRDHFLASKRSPLFCKISNEANGLRLHVSGVIVDQIVDRKITTMYNGWRLDKWDISDEHFLNHLSRSSRLIAQRNKGKRSEPGMCWRTLCGNLFSVRGEFKTPNPDFQKWFQEPEIYSQEWVTRLEDDPRRAFLESCRLFVSHGNHIGITKAGRGANLPRESGTGDYICLVAGSNVPLVVRLIGKNVYKLIGWCYLDGAMYGELWPGNDIYRLPDPLDSDYGMVLQ